MKPRGLTLSSLMGLIVVSLLLVAAGGKTYAAATPTPSPIPVIKPSPTSSAAWTARELDRIIIGGGWGGIVRVWIRGQYGLPVTIRAAGGAWSASNFVGSKPENGPDALEFAPVWPGRYVITPQGLGISYTLDVSPGHVAQVRFEPGGAIGPPSTPAPTPTPKPPSSPTPLPGDSTLDAPTTLAPAPRLLEPPDNTAVSLKIRLDLDWTWEGTLGPDDYFQVEIWNDFNDFSTPVDVAWVKDLTYRNDSNTHPIYGPEYRWRITVIRGTPTREKDWSTAENRVWEQNNESQPISQESETRTLIIDPACPPGDRSC